MMNDLLAKTLSALNNAGKVGKKEVTIGPISKTATKILKIMQENGYISEFEIEETNNGDLYRIPLLHKINKCGVIKPRFPVKKTDFLKWEKRYLPAEGFGILIVSTPKGLMTQKKAREKGMGGKLIAFVY